jgi:hypothetical protein
MVYRVYLIDLIPGHPPELLQEFESKDNASKFGYDKAEKYCQGKEKPHVCNYNDKNRILILTPTDFAILIKEE